MFGWDWSSTTHHHGDDAVPVLLDALRASYVEAGPGLQGWRQSAVGFDADGYKVGTVYFGGDRGDVHVVATSSAAHAAREAVTGLHGAKTARVDTRVDTLVPFDELAALIEDAGQMYGSLVTRIESSERGESRGRTIYLGAPKSAIRVRVYEKWLESPGQYVEGTNRVEVQLRPASRVKEAVSEWAPVQTFGCSRVTRRLADALGDELVPTTTLQVSRGTPDLERSLEAMGEQYGNAVDRFLEWSGGDVDAVLDHLLRRRRVREWELEDARSLQA